LIPSLLKIAWKIFFRIAMLGWGCNSVAEYLPRMGKALGFIPTPHTHTHTHTHSTVKVFSISFNPLIILLGFLCYEINACLVSKEEREQTERYKEEN
jgi:hypothetical protein